MVVVGVVSWPQRCVAVVGARCLGDSLAVRNLGVDELYGQFLVVLEAPFQRAQVELTLSVYNCLP